MVSVTVPRRWTRNSRQPTRQLDSIVLLCLQNVQQRIDESGLRFGLNMRGRTPESQSSRIRPHQENPATYIFQIQLRLLTITRIRV